MIKNKIFFRVDSGTKVGYGHLIRCLSLAENLKKYYKVIFISSILQGNIINELKIKKFPVYKLKSYSNHIDEKNDAKKTILLIKKYGGQKNLMIVDNYGLSKKWENTIYRNGSMHDFWIWKNIKKIDVPVYVITPKNNEFGHFNYGRKLKSRNNKFLNLIIKDSSHLFPLEKAQETSDLILSKIIF